jgi:hypothetical protein
MLSRRKYGGVLLMNLLLDVFFAKELNMKACRNAGFLFTI